MSNDFSLADVKFVKRITIGSIDPNKPLDNQTKEEQVKLLNACLNDVPKGKIIGKEVDFAIFQVGEHQLTMQSTTYHIGFSRKPTWLNERG